MTEEQMIDRIERAEKLHARLIELEREQEEAGLYEEALETRRLRNDQEASMLYWRERAAVEHSTV
jgi:hypothetical protein